MSSQNCSQCGAEIPLGAELCPHCAWSSRASTAMNPPRRVPKWAWWALAFGTVCLLAMMVGAVLGVLALPGIMEKQALANRAKLEADLREIRAALELYAARHDGRYPERLDALVAPDANGERFLDREALPLDPWHHAYRYDPPDALHRRSRIYTYGLDQKPGGVFESADVDESMFDKPPAAAR